MSDRGKAHNFGQVLFESLGAGLGAYGIFLQRETERKSDFQQQSFLNRLREESGARAQVGLEQGQERLLLAQKGFDLSQDRFGFEQEKFATQQEIDPIEQSQIDLRGAQQSAAEALETQRRTGGTSKPLTAKSRVDLLQNVFKQSVKGGRERLLGETIGRLGELGAFTSGATPVGGDLFAENPSGGLPIIGGATDRKPPTNILGLRGFLAQNPELAQDSAVGDLSQRLFGLGSQAHQQAFTATPDSAFAINPFVAQRIFPEVDLESLRIDDTGSEVDSIVDEMLRRHLGE